MATLIAYIREIDFTAGGTMTVQLLLEHVSGGKRGISLSGSAAAITSANFTSLLKTQLQTFAQSHYGATLQPTDILVWGAPQ